MNNDRAAKQAVIAIIRKSGRFLFVKRSVYVEAARGYWCPVSGKVEAGESQEQAVCREVMEEVGLTVDAVRNVAQITTSDNRYILNFWTTEILSGEARIASREVADLIWVTKDEMADLSPVFDEDVRILQELKE